MPTKTFDDGQIRVWYGDPTIHEQFLCPVTPPPGLRHTPDWQRGLHKYRVINIKMGLSAPISLLIIELRCRYI